MGMTELPAASTTAGLHWPYGHDWAACSCTTAGLHWPYGHDWAACSQHHCWPTLAIWAWLSCLQPAPLLAYTGHMGMTELPVASTTAGLHWPYGHDWAAFSQHHCWPTLAIWAWLSCLQPAPLLAYIGHRGMTKLPAASTTAGLHWPYGHDWAAFSQHHCWPTLALWACSEQRVVLFSVSSLPYLMLSFPNFFACVYCRHCSLKRCKIIWGCYNNSLVAILKRDIIL